MQVELGGRLGVALTAFTALSETRRSNGGTPLPLEAILGLVAFVGLFMMWAVIPACLRKR